jgi:hypothetical protein
VNVAFFVTLFLYLQPTRPALYNVCQRWEDGEIQYSLVYNLLVGTGWGVRRGRQQPASDLQLGKSAKKATGKLK